MMKKWLMIALVATVSLPAMAEQTVTLGYAYGKTSDGPNLKGANIKYQRDIANNWGVIGSATYMQGDEKFEYLDVRDIMKGEVDSKYYSLAVGPTYRVHDKVRLYGLVGIAHTKNTGRLDWWNYNGASSPYTLEKSWSESVKRTSVNYGVGVQVYPVKNLAIDVAYEGAPSHNGRDNKVLNSFHIGLGYHF